MMKEDTIGPVSGIGNNPFMSAKLSLGDIMATEMYASDDAITNKVEIDINSIKYVLDILN